MLPNPQITNAKLNRWIKVVKREMEWLPPEMPTEARLVLTSEGIGHLCSMIVKDSLWTRCIKTSLFYSKSATEPHTIPVALSKCKNRSVITDDFNTRQWVRDAHQNTYKRALSHATISYTDQSDEALELFFCPLQQVRNLQDFNNMKNPHLSALVELEDTWYRNMLVLKTVKDKVVDLEPDAKEMKLFEEVISKFCLDYIARWKSNKCGMYLQQNLPPFGYPNYFYALRIPNPEHQNLQVTYMSTKSKIFLTNAWQFVSYMESLEKVESIEGKLDLAMLMYSQVLAQYEQAEQSLEQTQSDLFQAKVELHRAYRTMNSLQVKLNDSFNINLVMSDLENELKCRICNKFLHRAYSLSCGDTFHPSCLWCLFKGSTQEDKILATDITQDRGLQVSALTCPACSTEITRKPERNCKIEKLSQRVSKETNESDGADYRWDLLFASAQT
ncbi:uncharacterized protein EV420DRAFT_1482086 [Desarmillaria tabescens]|uniref:RING-type domain-containing protein n=1 Tax=Armillaria tabescens TaxID=1929756 RepID=A0AA39K1H0_ARMTA|nr:uncharacterized protein EV420DRAFT_1482086 [Desarmillaria tabescens]KAK0452785.1 hypothetical protein EV420DRAFT_1482086 [Desarmillaria tabescens]